MTYAQLQERRNKIMHDAGTLAQSKHADAETRVKVTAMLAEADELAEQAKNAQRLEAHAEELRSSTRPPRGGIGEVSELEQTKLAFRSWMRSGVVRPEHRSYLREARDLGSFQGVGVTSNTISSSVLLPVGFDPLLSVAQRSFGQLVGAVRSLRTESGEPQKYAMLDDTENSLTLLPTEVTAVTETDMNLAGGVSYVDDLTTGLVTVSNNLLNDAAFSVSDFISTTFGSRYYRGLAQMIQQGNGSHIASIAANVPVGATTGSAGGSIVLNDLINTFTSLDPAYHDSAQWSMSPLVKSELLMLTDNYNHPIFTPDPSGTPFNAIYGRSIISSTYAPTAAPGNVPILFGDFSSYTLRTVGSLEIIRLQERYAEMNLTGFIGRCRAGGYSTLQAASPAIVGLKMHA